ncbi:AraC family transcriptional regulator [Leucobacter sp. NPDC058333]|uniref:AraC family transcriptional regulator n=1 Tax=Leucobacter sp. NPDC058333 TaxID=3346450 RepID=UPI00365E1120
MITCRTADIDEAVSAVARVYCDHTLRVVPQSSIASGPVAMRLRATDGMGAGLVSLAYGADVEVDPGELQGMTLVKHAVSGRANVRQARETSVLRAGRTLIVSGNRPTRYEYDRAFAQISLRLDPAMITTRFGEVVGAQLESEVRFELRPLPSEVESAWSQIIHLAVRDDVLPAASTDHLGKIGLDLLLQRVAHNHSGLLSQEVAPSRTMLSRALDTIDAIPDYEVPTAGDIAARMGVSLRTIERLFREEAGMSPTRYLRNRRLDRVRAHLETGPEGILVADAAAAQGFYHAGRFAQQYRERFGETPSTTAQRAAR